MANDERCKRCKGLVPGGNEAGPEGSDYFACVQDSMGRLVLLRDSEFRALEQSLQQLLEFSGRIGQFEVALLPVGYTLNSMAEALGWPEAPYVREF